MKRKYLIVGSSLLIVLLLAGALIAYFLQGTTPAPDEGKQTAAAPPLQGKAGDTLVTLTWQAMPEASGYFVYRDKSEVPLNTVPITDTQYEDIGLTDGRVYTYAVAPANKDGQAGKRSADVSVSPKSN